MGDVNETSYSRQKEIQLWRLDWIMGGGGNECGPRMEEESHCSNKVGT